MTDDPTPDFDVYAPIVEALGGSRLLAKATYEPSAYRCGLVDGTVFTFESASIRDAWLLLHGAAGESLPDHPDRVVEVRISAITWVAEAPHWV